MAFWRNGDGGQKTEIHSPPPSPPVTTATAAEEVPIFSLRLPMPLPTACANPAKSEEGGVRKDDEKSLWLFFPLLLRRHHVLQVGVILVVRVHPHFAAGGRRRRRWCHKREGGREGKEGGSGNSPLAWKSGRSHERSRRRRKKELLQLSSSSPANVPFAAFSTPPLLVWTSPYSLPSIRDTEVFPDFLAAGTTAGDLEAISRKESFSPFLSLCFVLLPRLRSWW